ncbi:MAG: ABC transporter ATP-binding protein, partial [Clostridiales bacterium]|nr:ABC transporter ATP-binding protein [Clostridiales bacterium]
MKVITNWFKKFKGTSGYAKWLFVYTKPYIPSLALLMLINAASSGISVGMAVIGKQIIDNAINGGDFKSKIILYVAVIIIVQVIGIICSLFSVMINEKFSFGIRKQIYDKILNTSYHQILKYHTGDLMTRFTSDCGSIANGIASVIPSIITLCVEFIITFTVLVQYDALLAVFAVLIAPICAVVSFWLGRKLKRLQIKVQESESAYRSFIQESLSNILIIKTFCSEKYSSERLSELRNERFYWVFKKTKMGLVASSAIGLGFQGGYILAFAWGAVKLSTKTITYGTMSVFLALVNRIQSPILGLANTIPSIVSVLASAGRVMEIQELPLETRLEGSIEPKQIGVEIQDLSFGYTDELLLEHTSMSIRPNEFVAIVGESGIGKTTLIRLIMAFMNTNQGNILFRNEKGEEQIANGNSREFLSYVPQGNTLFSGSIKSNVLMGKRDATDDEINEALKAASAYHFVNELPDGINTIIGERGYGISEGQAQRIAIARALIKKAPFLILDEATSSLDEKTEL